MSEHERRTGKFLEHKPWHNRSPGRPPTKRSVQEAFPGYFDSDVCSPTSPFEHTDSPPRATPTMPRTLNDDVEPHPLRKRRETHDGKAKLTDPASPSPNHVAIDVEAEKVTGGGIKRRMEAVGQHQMPPQSVPTLPDVIIQDYHGVGHLEVPQNLTYSFPAILGHPSGYLWDILTSFDQRTYGAETGGSSVSDYGQCDDKAL